MFDSPLLAVALGAGLLAAVNPCGFALLPAYLSLLVLGDQPPTRSRAVGARTSNIPPTSIAQGEL